MSQAKEQAILFSAPMVRAILDGRKKVTRRSVRIQPRSMGDVDSYGFGQPFIRHPDPIKHDPECPCGHQAVATLLERFVNEDAGKFYGRTEALAAELAALAGSQP